MKTNTWGIKFLCALILLGVLLISVPSIADQFTTSDRERMVRTETKIETMVKNIEARIESLYKRIDTLQSFMLWGFGILFGGMGVLIGFVIWDRRTAVEPFQRKTQELMEREDKVERVLREYAKKQPALQAILRSLNL